MKGHEKKEMKNYLVHEECLKYQNLLCINQYRN